MQEISETLGFAKELDKFFPCADFFVETSTDASYRVIIPALIEAEYSWHAGYLTHEQGLVRDPALEMIRVILYGRTIVRCTKEVTGELPILAAKEMLRFIASARSAVKEKYKRLGLLFRPKI